MENNHDDSKEPDLFSQPELEQEIEWVRRLLELEGKDFPLPESLKSQNLLEKIRGIVPDIPLESSSTATPEVSAKQTGEEKKKGKILFFKFASCAACLALVLFGWRHMAGNGSQITQISGGMLGAPAASSSTAAPAPGAAMVPQALAAAPADGVEEMALDADVPVEAGHEIELPKQPSAADYDQVYDAVSAIYEKRNTPSANRQQFAAGDTALLGVAPVAPTTRMKPNTGGGNAEASVSSTNVQVEGVDEADIIKTDGVYLYHYRLNTETGGGEIAITAANGLKPLSTIKLTEYTDAELYVNDDRLALVQTASEDRVQGLLETLEAPVKAESSTADSDLIVPDYIKPDEGDSFEPIDMVELLVYDLTDRKNPKEMSRYQQDGNYVSSRLSGDTIYLVTNKSLYSFNPGDGPVPMPRYLPVMGENGKATTLDAPSILLPPYQENLNYAIVSAFNLGEKSRETKAVLGMADQIMMSGDTLFLTASIPAEGEDISWWNRSDTGITRFAVADGALGYQSSGRVPGLIDNQFSLDEYEGNLRISTTSRNEDGESVNNVYIYDETMKKIGGVENLAPGERIYSTRFLGDTAYLVTYRQVDPLFVIDLSNPKQPVVKGELKISGFSEYLHPLDENTLIGFGRNTIPNQRGGSTEDGIKLSLFDVSNPSDPKEISSYLIGNSGSESLALDNHKAFLFDAQNSMIGFPVTVRTSNGASVSRPWSGESNVTFSGYLLFYVRENGFELFGTLPSEGQDVAEGFNRTDPANSIDRGVYIGKTFYTIANSRIRAYSLDNFAPLGELAYEKSV